MKIQHAHFSDKYNYPIPISHLTRSFHFHPKPKPRGESEKVEVLISSGMSTVLWFFVILLNEFGQYFLTSNIAKATSKKYFFPILRSAESDEERESFRLPIFPLSKSILFPTQILNLNLYEPRYLALAKDVLSSDFSDGTSPIFGAVFNNNRPRIVIPDSSNKQEYANTRRNNPLTPLFQKGDIGVICSVLYSNVISNDQNETEKIQMQAIAIGRFRIEKMLQTGYKDKEDFILVEASNIIDANDYVNGSMGGVSTETLEKYLYETILDIDNFLVDKLYWENKRSKKSRRGGTLKLGNDSDEGNKSENSDLSILHQLSPGSHIPSVFNQAYSSKLSTHTSDKEMELDHEYIRMQLFSFAVASNFVLGEPTEEMLNLLRMTSTSERLKYLIKVIERDSWLTVKARKILKGSLS